MTKKKERCFGEMPVLLETSDMNLDEVALTSYSCRLNRIKKKHRLLKMIDSAILEGAEMKKGYFVFLLQEARNELLKDTEDM